MKTSFSIHNLTARTLFLVLCTLFFMNPANAVMQLSDSIVFFEPGKPSRHDITVFNPDDEDLYVKVELLEVKNPGLPNEKQIAVTNPDEISLLITPNKLLIPAHGQKSIRLINVKPHGKTERVFRATATPVTGKAVATQSGIKLMIAYGILIFVQPEKPNGELVVTRTGTKFHVKNIGNTNTVLTKGKQCSGSQGNKKNKEKNDCLELQSKRLYAGEEWTQDLPKDAPVEYTLKTGNKFSVVIYP